MPRRDPAASPSEPSAHELSERLSRAARELSGEVVVALSTLHPAARPAAALAEERSYCRPLLVGAGSRLGPALERDPRRLEMLDLLLRLPGGLRIGLREAERLAADPTLYASLLVASGRAQAAVAGSPRSLATALRSTLGPSLDGPGLVLGHLVELAGRTLVFGWAVEARPSAVELAAAATSLAGGLQSLLGEDPRLALIAHDAPDGAPSEASRRVEGAVAMLAEDRPTFALRGRLSATEALSTEGAEGLSSTAAANVLMFPDADSGKISLELTERLAGARVAGPLLLGASRPASPFTGDSVGEMLDQIVLVAVEAERGSP